MSRFLLIIYIYIYIYIFNIYIYIYNIYIYIYIDYFRKITSLHPIKYLVNLLYRDSYPSINHI